MTTETTIQQNERVIAEPFHSRARKAVRQLAENLFCAVWWTAALLAFHHVGIPTLQPLYQAEAAAGGPVVVVLLLVLILLPASRWVRWFKVVFFPLWLLWHWLSGYALILLRAALGAIALGKATYRTVTNQFHRGVCACIFIGCVILSSHATHPVHLWLLVITTGLAMGHMFLSYALWVSEPYGVAEGIVRRMCAHLGRLTEQIPEDRKTRTDEQIRSALDLYHKASGILESAVEKLEMRRVQGVYLSCVLGFYFAVLVIGFAAINLCVINISSAVFHLDGEATWAKLALFSVFSATGRGFSYVSPGNMVGWVLVAMQSVLALWLLVVQILNVSAFAVPQVGAAVQQMKNEVMTVRNRIVSSMETETGRGPDDEQVDEIVAESE